MRSLVQLAFGVAPAVASDAIQSPSGRGFHRRSRFLGNDDVVALGTLGTVSTLPFC